MKAFLLAFALLALGIAGMCITLLLRKDGKFPEYEVGSNAEMRRRGITCFKDEDARLQRQACDGNYSEACKDCGLYKKN